MNKRDELVQRSAGFLELVKDLTPGSEVEQWLNSQYDADSALYRDLAALVRAGVEEGWAANTEVTGPHYRRSRICEPCAQTSYFSITAVYMDSSAAPATDGSKVLRGDYHGHPYGELNMVVPLNDGAELAGPNGWSGAGWTAPGPGSHHYPEVRGGAVIALFFLPAGRISYKVKPQAQAAA
jgi:hypothetical protein